MTHDDDATRGDRPEPRLLDAAMSRALGDEPEELPELDESARARILVRILTEDER